ncbi:hypothetical protein DFR86_00450 [Acidianus sulfidivorans JP7]|uniref:Type IV pilin n=1 Tax=Acidianus sulfidivorans JP7 TaxID=619593 RepID=A0A2U9IJQ2_9CREN|nr:hypothetical protein [Acidianus sulfidivorans]AWR96164.1 hypothetical protein DFR86_00450 [Acidianus sulfidivorans JP7]
MAKELKRRKGLSEVIGFLIIIILIVAVAIPIAFTLLSLPSEQAQSSISALPYKNLADQQLQDFEATDLTSNGPVQPVYFVYNGSNTAYFVFISGENPPVPVTVKDILINSGKGWEIYPYNLNVSLQNANTEVFGFKAIKVSLPAIPTDGLAVVTNYGNIIYASPISTLSSLFGGVKKPIGISAFNLQSFKVLQDPTLSYVPGFFSLSPFSESITQFEKEYARAYGVSIYSGELVPSQGYNGTYDGFWYGPMTVKGGVTFIGRMNGQFRGANVTFDEGSFNGFMEFGLGPFLSPAAIWITNANASDLTLSNISVVCGNLNGTYLGEILLEPSFSLSPESDVINLNSISGEIYFSNVSISSLDFTGKLTGICPNGKPINIKTGKNNYEIFSGQIVSGTLIGKIRSAEIGFMNSVSSFSIPPVQISGNFRGDIQIPQSSSLFNSVSVILSGTLNGKILNTELQPSSLSISTLDGKLKGVFTISSVNGQGKISGTIILGSPSLLDFLGETAFTGFDGSIHGVFSFGGSSSYIKLGGEFGLEANVLSVKSSTLNITTPSFGSIEVMSPLVVDVSTAIGNPSSQTLVINSVTATMQVYAIFSLSKGTSGGQTGFGATLFGSATDNLTTPIVVKPLNVYYTNLTLIIPVNTFPFFYGNEPTNQNFFNITGYTIQFIKLYLTFNSPNGYSITVSTIIPPYSIPTYGNYTS